MVVDLGTGDGLFVYHSARANPQNFYIGIDPNCQPLEKISEKICRQPSSGGASNAMYIQASAENLPEELECTAGQVEVLFPWGSLLRSMIAGESHVLREIRRICSPGAMVRIIVSQDLEKDRSLIKRLGLPKLSIEYFQSILIRPYSQAGFRVVENVLLNSFDIKNVNTSWARRLRHSKGRSVYLLRVVAS